MRPIDGVGTLNPALTNQAFVRPPAEPTDKTEKPEPVSSTTKTQAAATGVGHGLTGGGEFKPVVGPSEPTQTNLPNSYKSSQSHVDVTL